VERATLSAEALPDTVSVTVSVGVALFPDHAHELEELIDIADRAMYASKEMGRNRVTLSGSELTHLAAA
jgi:diguanylate cyclase (GGDEF)-like protein